MRNVIKQAEQGRELVRKHIQTDLTVGEVQQLYDLYKQAPTPADGIYDLIGNAFYMGYAVGHRSAK